MKIVSTLLLSVILAACLTLDTEGGYGPYRIPQGTVITLNQELTVAAGLAHVNILGTPIGDRHHYDANCRLETWTLAKTPVTIKTDEFTVTKVTRESYVFSGLIAGAQYAGPVYFMEGPRLLYYDTHIYLRSPRQPDVYRLTCGHLQDSAMNPRHLTAMEIRKTLEPVMTMRLP